MQLAPVETELSIVTSNLEQTAAVLEKKSHNTEARIVRAHLRRLRSESFRKQVNRTMRLRGLPSGAAIDCLIEELADSFSTPSDPDAGQAANIGDHARTV